MTLSECRCHFLFLVSFTTEQNDGVSNSNSTSFSSMDSRSAQRRNTSASQCPSRWVLWMPGSKRIPMLWHKMHRMSRVFLATKLPEDAEIPAYRSNRMARLCFAPTKHFQVGCRHWAALGSQLLIVSPCFIVDVIHSMNHRFQTRTISLSTEDGQKLVVHFFLPNQNALPISQ